jgi:hypothetical protein
MQRWSNTVRRAHDRYSVEDLRKLWKIGETDKVIDYILGGPDEIETAVALFESFHGMTINEDARDFFVQILGKYEC